MSHGQYVQELIQPGIVVPESMSLISMPYYKGRDTGQAVTLWLLAYQVATGERKPNFTTFSSSKFKWLY